MKPKAGRRKTFHGSQTQLSRALFSCRRLPRGGRRPFELELELIQPHMAQKPVLRGEVGARALRVRSVSREEAWASVGVQGAWVSGCGCEAD